MKKDFTFIDLFAGIGGFHIALNYQGGKCVYASEWDKKAAEVYARNFNLIPDGDITTINEKDIPEHDVLCAGFPCQAFSISGKQKGFEDTRGTLFFDVARIVNYHHPKVILLENVKNLFRHDKGKTFNTIKNTLENLGYKVFHSILNASQFSLPQNRERIFVVCIRKDLNWQDFNFPIGKNLPICVKDILEQRSGMAIIERDDIDIYKKYEPEHDAGGKIIYPNRPIQIGKVNKGGQGERIYDIRGHGITLSAYGGGVGAKTGLFLTDNGIRRLSPRECARMQGFPDSFELARNKNDAYKQFGNSVPINIVKEIANNFINIL